MAPEHVRSTTEAERSESKPETWSDIQQLLQRKGGTHQLVDLTTQRAPNIGGLETVAPQASQGVDPFSSPATTHTHTPDAAAATHPAPSPDLHFSQQPDVEPSVNSFADAGSRRSSGLTEPTSVPQPTELSPEQIALPDSDDDELLVIEDPFRLGPKACWVYEIFVTDADIEQWRHSQQPHEMAFLASAAKRQRAEVRMSHLSPEHQKEFEKAKACEIDSWLHRHRGENPEKQDPYSEHLAMSMGAHLETH